MNCPQCNSTHLGLVNARSEPHYTFRSYHCHSCYHIVHTHEYLQSARRVAPLVSACEELQRTKDQLRSIAQRLEQLQFDLAE